MNRREVLKALAAVPIAAAISGCDHHREEEKSDRLEIHLDDAFAVVIRQDQGNSIKAFSPRANDVSHQLLLNGYQLPENKAAAYDFKLSADDLRKEFRPDVNVGLRDFYFQTENWHVPDSLITLELPCPKSITFSGQVVPVMFENNHWQVWMPTNHILEYDVKPGARPKIGCEKLAQDRCAPSSDSPEGLSRFFFEVGPRNAPKSHAISFFNYILQTAFPDLKDKYKLAPREHTNEQQAHVLSSKMVPAMWQFHFPTNLYKPVTYTLDCELGGPVVGTKTAPTKP